MADEGAVAVAEAPIVDAGAAGESSQESTQSTEQTTEQTAQEKLDGRNQPDALKKRISELRRSADAMTDPAQKAALLADAKALNDTVGKGRAYEQIYPTVREAREAKTLMESFGGREGLVKVQATLAEVEAIDNALSSGDPSVIEKLFSEAPEGMVKLAPMIFANLEKTNPEAYAKAVTPHAVKFFDTAGFPEAFDEMVTAYKAGDKAKGDKLSAEMARWFSAQRTQTTQAPKVDPETERLRKELETRTNNDSKAETDRAFNDVQTHAAPILDKFLKVEVGKLGLSQEQMTTLRKHAWDHLQDTRNADETYKTIVKSKYKQGMGEVAKYVKSETENRAEDAAKYVAKLYYGHQLKNGAVKATNATATPITPGVTRGKEPTPAEIDYGPKGIQAAKKAGFKDLGDMILAGKAPMNSGGIRQWR